MRDGRTVPNAVPVGMIVLALLLFVSFFTGCSESTGDGQQYVVQGPVKVTIQQDWGSGSSEGEGTYSEIRFYDNYVILVAEDSNAESLVPVSHITHLNWK